MNSVYYRARVGAAVALCGLAATCVSAQTPQKSHASIRRITMLGGNEAQELEISASQPVSPAVVALTGPDRLVIDFPNALPDAGLRNILVNRGSVKSVRIGLFAQNPPVTRVVLDLKAAQQYQIFPSGRTVILKLGAGASAAPIASRTVTSATAVSAARTIMPAPYAPVITAQRGNPAPRLDVDFQNGRLTIRASKATLAEVLSEVHQRTGAEIPIPAGADQEQVVANFGPGPARDVLTALLNGTRFNFILVGSDGDATQLKSVILTARGEGVSQPAIQIPSAAVAQSDPEPPPQEMPPQQPPPDAAPPPQ